MKTLFRTTFLLLAVFTVFSCSSDDDNPTIIGGDGPFLTIKGGSYDMSMAQPNGGVIQIIDENNDNGLATAQISLSGIKDTKLGNVTFYLSYVEADDISGTYMAGELGQDGYYDSEGSSYAIMEVVDETQQTDTGGGAEGTFKITHNSGNNYSVEFNVTYDNGTQAQGNFTHDFVFQHL